MNIYLIIILVFSVPSLLAIDEELDKISLRCADSECSNPISNGSIVTDYPATDSKYKIKLKKGDNCEVFGMSNDGNILLARVNKQEGIISNIFYREEKVLVPKKTLVGGKWNKNRFSKSSTLGSAKKEQNVPSKPAIKEMVENNQTMEDNILPTDEKKSFETYNNFTYNDSLVNTNALPSEQNFTNQVQDGNYSVNINESKIEPSPTLDPKVGDMHVNDSFNNSTNDYNTYKTENLEKEPLEYSNGDHNANRNQPIEVTESTLTAKPSDVHINNTVNPDNITNHVDDNSENAEGIFSKMIPGNESSTKEAVPNLMAEPVSVTDQHHRLVENQQKSTTNATPVNQTDYFNTTATTLPESSEVKSGLEPTLQSKITDGQPQESSNKKPTDDKYFNTSSPGLDKVETNAEPMSQNKSVDIQFPESTNETDETKVPKTPVTTPPEYVQMQTRQSSDATLTDNTNLKTPLEFGGFKTGLEQSYQNKNSVAKPLETLNEMHTGDKDLNTASDLSTIPRPEVQTELEPTLQNKITDIQSPETNSREHANETNLSETPLNTLPEADKSQPKEVANKIAVDDLSSPTHLESDEVKEAFEPTSPDIISDTLPLKVSNDTHAHKTDLNTPATPSQENDKVKTEMKPTSETIHTDVQPQAIDLNKSVPSTASSGESKTVMETSSETTSSDVQHQPITYNTYTDETDLNKSVLSTASVDKASTGIDHTSETTGSDVQHETTTFNKYIYETDVNKAPSTTSSEEAKTAKETQTTNSETQPTEVKEISLLPTEEAAKELDYKADEYDDITSEFQKRSEAYEEIGVTIGNGGDCMFSALYSALASFQDLFSKSPSHHGDFNKETDTNELDIPSNLSEEVDIPYTQEHVSKENFSDGDSSWMSWKTVLLLVFTSGVILVFSLGSYYIENSKRDVELMMKNNSLADELFILQKERITLEERLQQSEEAVNKFSKESSMSTYEVEALKAELSQLKMEKSQAEEREQGLIKKCNMLETNYSKLRQLFSENKQKGERSALIADIKKLKESSNNEILSLKDQLELKSEEIKTLMVKLQKSNDTKDKLEEKLNLMMSEEQVAVKHYQDSVAKLEQTIEDSKATVIKLEDEMGKLKKECESLTIEKELAESALQKAHGLKSSESLSRWLESKEVRLSLVVAEKKLLELTEEKAALRKEKEELLEKQKLLENQIEDLNNKYEEAEKAKIEGLTRLKVLSDYFNEKETQLQEQLGTKEALWLQKQSDDHTIYEQMRSLREENQTYKSQNETLRKEIIDQETSFKKLIANAEEKADGYWVSLRQAERRLKESQVEAAQLRNRLTNLEISGDHLPEDKLKGMEVNGDMPPFGPATSPPFMLYPGEFIPPPPLISAPSRPPPLGRISSPTLGDFTPPLPLPPFDRYPPSPPPPPPQYLHKPQPRDGASRKQKDSQSSNHSSESTNEKSQRRSKR
ncbi:transport and Golgi organization protein 1 [Cimex lectularius]|uniref:Transport and Golgi organization protein 1 n=1 Tax=Cimex lectularius TaxID=79782 RepID=A0A8I6RTL0_CIMLE|nr:transport and Golgi organization protein 1 [Cimex lectularius]